MHFRKAGNGLEKAHFGPAQITENQRSRKGKTTFETFSTTSNVVFLMSYVSIKISETFFGMCGKAPPAI